MPPDSAADLINHGLRLVTMIIIVLVVPGMLVGLAIGLLQAATQINEQTLSFLPRMMITLLVLALAGPWVSGMLADFCREVFMQAAELARSG
jgi:flagellar biosynthesis protein FliQ